MLSNPVESNSHNSSATEPLAWYRYGMVWMIILLPLSVVLASLITVAIAHKNAPVIVETQMTSLSQPKALK